MKCKKKMLNYKLQTESINDKSEFHASHVEVLLIYVWWFAEREKKINLKIELH